MKRRDFLKASFCATTASLFTARSYARIMGSNDRVRLGCIGISEKSIGLSNLRNLASAKNTEIAAICDLYEPHMAAAAKEAPYADRHRDFRYVIDDQSIDAVCISTPDHWHAPMTLMAFEAGKHVYCEKPLGHYPYEVLAMMAGRKSYKSADGGPLVFQDGQWQQSHPYFVTARDAVRSGQIGTVRTVRSWFLQDWGGGLGPPATEAPYAEFSGTYDGHSYSPDEAWNLWIGPAPFHPFTKQLCHFQWRFILPYGSGMMGDWGIHLGPGIGLWVLEDMPKTSFRVTTRRQEMACVAAGDIANVPYDWHEEFDYGTFGIGFTHDGCVTKAQLENRKRDHGIEFVGTDGTIFVNRDAVTIRDAHGEYGYGVKPLPVASVKAEHCQNFIDAIRNGKPEECATSIECVGQQNFACLLAVAIAAMRLDNLDLKTIEVDPVTFELKTKNAAPYMMRRYRSPWDAIWDRILKNLKKSDPKNRSLLQI
jgi:predicted dehydrogenase